jgi:hypothetical protein
MMCGSETTPAGYRNVLQSGSLSELDNILDCSGV